MKVNRTIFSKAFADLKPIMELNSYIVEAGYTVGQLYMTLTYFEDSNKVNPSNN